MKAHRILLVVLCLALVLTALGAQAQDDNMNPATFGLAEGKPYDGITLKFLICCNTAQQFALLDKMTAEEFTPMTGITVEWGDVPFGTYQETLYLEASNPNTEYDIAAWVDAWGTNVKDFLYPLNDFVAQYEIDMSDYSPAYVGASTMGTAGTDNEIIYGLPFRGHPQILYYRTDVLEQLGMEPPATWQDLTRLGEAMAAAGMEIEPSAMYYGLNVDQNLFNWYSHLWGAGTDLFDENWEPIFNNEIGYEATVQYLSYLRDGYTAEQSTTLNEGDAWQEVIDGRAATYVGWWWRYSSMLGSAVPEVANNAGIAPAPGWEGGLTASYGYLWPVGVFAQSENVEASLQFLRWLTHPITELRSVSNETGDPAYDNNVAVRFSVLRDPNYNERFNNLGNVAADILADARTIPLIPEYTEMIPVLSEAINEMAVDPNADIQAVLDRAAEDVRDIMDSAGYYD